MKASLTHRSAMEKSLKILAFLPLIISLVYPEISLASSLQTEGQSSLVFTIEQKQKLLQFNDIVGQDPLVGKLQDYLKKHNSPLAEYAETIIQQPQWKRALAVSWVESNFARRCAYNNCSGIGGNPSMKTFRQYTTKLDWFADMSRLMERTMYKERFTTFKAMCGVYVQPCSSNWLRGATQKFNELEALEIEADQQTADASNTTIVAMAIN